MLLALRNSIYSWFRPAIDALIYGSHLPFSIRWRLLSLQPLSLLTYSIGTVPYLFSRPFTVTHIPVSSDRTIRALVFKAPKRGTNNGGLRPLHVDVHGGAFIGGLPESDATFCDLLARETGAVVVSLSYRYAPVHAFPAAIDDVDAAIAWLLENAEEKFGADPSLLTVSGFSAGGNLVLAASQAKPCHPPSKTNIKASVTFYGVMDLRLTPMEKPKPENFPKKDPLAWLMPLYDSYAEPIRAQNMENPRLSPILADVATLPENMLLVVPGIDILVHEQLTFVERVKADLETRGAQHRKVEVMFVEDGFHGWLEVPNVAVPLDKKMVVFDRGAAFIKATHKEHGWQWN